MCVCFCLFFNSTYSHSFGFPGGSDGKESACNAGDLSSVPGSGRSPGERNCNPLQYSCLKNLTDIGAWWTTVHRITKSWTQLSDSFSLQWRVYCTKAGHFHKEAKSSFQSFGLEPGTWTTLGFAEFWGWQLHIERHKQYIDLRKIFGVMSNSLLTSSKCWKMMVSKYEQNQLRLRNFLKEIWVNESGK